MKVNIESVSNIEKKLTIQIPEDHVQEHLEKAYKDALKKAHIPGFRPGKAPRSVIEKKYGPAIEADVYQDLVKESIATAVDEHKIKAITVTNITEPKRDKGNGFSYNAHVEVKPEISPKDYLGVKIDVKPMSITDKEVTDSLNHLLESQAVLKPRENALAPKMGDFVSITAEDVITKPGDENKKLSEQMYEVGAKNGQPNLDKALLKMQPGSSEVVTLENKTKDQGPDAKKEFQARITLKAIKEKVLPELNDAFAKSVGPFETLADLKKQLREDLEKEAQAKFKDQSAQKLLEVIVSKNPIEVPESLVKNEQGHLAENFKNQLRWSGMNHLPENYSEEKLNEELRPEALKRVQEQLLLEAIGEKEKIEASEAEIEAELSKIAEQSKVSVPELKTYYENSGRIDSLKFQIIAQKTIDFLISKASTK